MPNEETKAETTANDTDVTKTSTDANTDTNTEVSKESVDNTAKETTDTSKTEEKTDTNKEDTNTGKEQVEYKINLPEGITLSDEDKTSFIELAKSKKLKPDDVQAIIDYQSARELKRIEAYEAKLKKQADELKKDPELGGANYDKNLAIALKAVETFGGQELKDFFNETGLGNDRRLFKAFVNIGSKISEDSILKGGNSQDNDVPRSPGGKPMLKYKGM